MLSEPCERRSSSACAAGNAHPINANTVTAKTVTAKTVAAKTPIDNAELSFAGSIRLIGMASNPDDAVMQPLDRIE
ncbi:MAG: hypothetical protein JF604_03460 [Bradyrhizobium sp.]|nr:hypothetical protein [Bradyrhizobium sp.]